MTKYYDHILNILTGVKMIRVKMNGHKYNVKTMKSEHIKISLPNVSLRDNPYNVSFKRMKRQSYEKAPNFD